MRTPRLIYCQQLLTTLVMAQKGMVSIGSAKHVIHSPSILRRQYGLFADLPFPRHVTVNTCLQEFLAPSILHSKSNIPSLKWIETSGWPGVGTSRYASTLRRYCRTMGDPTEPIEAPITPPGLPANEFGSKQYCNASFFVIRERMSAYLLACKWASTIQLSLSTALGRSFTVSNMVGSSATSILEFRFISCFVLLVQFSIFEFDRSRAIAASPVT